MKSVFMGSTGVAGRIIPTSAPRPPPPPRRRSLSSPSLRAQSTNVHHHHQIQDEPIQLKTPRRSALLLPLAAIIPTPSAEAADFGIPGPKEWLRDQKKKAARFVLAPIDASRQSLQAAFLLLKASDSATSGEDSSEVRRLLNSASRDCVPQTRSSLVAFQAGSGVEVCTFRLIVNNAASLLDKSDPVKLEAEAMLDDLIRSFSSLGSTIDNSDFQLTSDREKVKDGLTGTISVLDKFEQGIKDCLGV